MNTKFLYQELLNSDLAALGLIDKGKITIPEKDINAMLQGRRSELLTLKDLDAGSFRIAEMQAKLSLYRGTGNSVRLSIHPIYLQPRYPEGIEPELLKKLLDPKEVNLFMEGTKGEADRVFEFDFQTREYLSYFPKQVEVPEAINCEALNERQRSDFRNGKMVTLSDGTHIQHYLQSTAGVISDREKMIFTFQTDEGTSHVLIEDIDLYPLTYLEQLPYQTLGFQRAMSLLDEKKTDFARGRVG